MQIIDYLTVALVFLAAVAAFISLRAAKASERAAKATEISTQAAFVNEAFREYEELLDAMKNTREWGEAHREHIALYSQMAPSKDNSHVLRNYGMPDQIWESSARKVKTFFKRYYALYKDDFITEKTFNACANRYGARLLMDFVLPMEKCRLFQVSMDTVVSDKDYRAATGWYAELGQLLEGGAWR